LKEHVQAMPHGNLLKLIRSTECIPYLSTLLEDSFRVYSIKQARKSFVENSEDLQAPENELEENLIAYLTKVVQQYTIAHFALKASYKAALDLRTHIREAMAQQELDAELLKGLRLKLDALNQHFYEAGVFLGHYALKHTLIWEEGQW
jgi:hypothetical protein